jgi:hypothetical protein
MESYIRDLVRLKFIITVFLAWADRTSRTQGRQESPLPLLTEGRRVKTLMRVEERGSTIVLAAAASARMQFLPCPPRTALAHEP